MNHPSNCQPPDHISTGYPVGPQSHSPKWSNTAYNRKQPLPFRAECFQFTYRSYQ